MEKLTLLLIGILFATLAITQEVDYVEMVKKISKAEGYPDYHSLIVKQANEKWKGDYSMIAHEVKKECKAMYYFFSMEKPKGMPKKIFANIQTRAMLKWTKMDFDNKFIEAVQR